MHMPRKGQLMQIKIKLVHELSHKKHTSMYDSPQPKLGKSHYSPPYNTFCKWSWRLKQNDKYFKNPKWEVLKIS
jgi:hypothetical protein